MRKVSCPYSCVYGFTPVFAYYFTAVVPVGLFYKRVYVWLYGRFYCRTAVRL